jgi:hypothetical protein
MKTVLRTALFVCAALPVSVCGCRAPAAPKPGRILASFAAAAAELPDFRTEGASGWFAERTPGMGSYLIELRTDWPLRFRARGRLRLFILGGRARIRSGPEQRDLGPGSFVSVPPRVPYRIKSLDGGPVRLLMCVMPDGRDVDIIEMPHVMRRLYGGPRT